MSASTSNVVSNVVEAARGIFSKRLPAEELRSKDIEGILATLGKITVAQVGLTKKAEEERLRTSSLLKRKSQRPPITYYHIYDSPDFTVGIFCIPENCDIPIHDHPDMTVYSKVLYGKVHVEAYDEALDLQSKLEVPLQNGALLACKVRDDVVSEETGCFALQQEQHPQVLCLDELRDLGRIGAAVRLFRGEGDRVLPRAGAGERRRKEPPGGEGERR